MTTAPAQTLTASRPTSAPPAPSVTPGGRDPWFDNAKMVPGDAGRRRSQLDAAAGDRGDRPGLRLALPLAHAGLRAGHRLPRPDASPTRRRNLRRLMTTVVVPYLVFEGLFAAFRVVRRRRDAREAVAQPALADVVPRRAVRSGGCSTPALRRLPWAFPVTVAVSLLGGLGERGLPRRQPDPGAAAVLRRRGCWSRTGHLEWLRSRGRARRAATVGPGRRRRPDSVRGVGAWPAPSGSTTSTAYGDLHGDVAVTGRRSVACCWPWSFAMSAAALALDPP